MIKKLLLVLSLCFIPVFAAGCGGAKLVSPDAFAKACEEYDTEKYDNVSDLIEDVSSEKLLKTGMYIQVEDIQIRKVMLNDKVDEIFAKAGDYTMQDLYSGKAETGTILVKYVKDGDASWLVGGSSLKFASEYEAKDYFKAQVGRFDADASEDGSGISYMIYNEPKNRSATTHAFYLEKDCVLSLVGYEYKTNAMADSINELCGYLKIDAPILDGIDCTKVTGFENRIGALAECYDVTEIEGSRYKDLDTLPYKTYYIKNAAPEEILQGGTSSGILRITSKNCDSVDALSDLNIDSSSVNISHMGGFIAMGFKFKDETIAKNGFDDSVKMIKEENKQHIISEDSGTDDGLEYFKLESNITVGYYNYAVFLEKDRVYLVCAVGLNQEQAMDFFEDVLEKMGL